MIVQMRDVEGMEFEEIAEIMQMHLNSIRVSLSRARKTMSMRWSFWTMRPEHPDSRSGHLTMIR